MEPPGAPGVRISSPGSPQLSAEKTENVPPCDGQLTEVVTLRQPAPSPRICKTCPEISMKFLSILGSPPLRWPRKRKDKTHTHTHTSTPHALQKESPSSLAQERRKNKHPRPPKREKKKEEKESRARGRPGITEAVQKVMVLVDRSQARYARDDTNHPAL